MDPYKIHGLRTSDIDNGSSDSGKSDFDEEYWSLKPPPRKISEHNIIVIMPNGKQKKVSGKQKRAAGKQGTRVFCSTDISKTKLLNKYHTVDEYGIVSSYTQPNNFFNVLESTDSEFSDNCYHDSGFKEHLESTSINTKQFFGAQNGLNSNIKKKRRGGKQKRIAERVQKQSNPLAETQKNVRRNDVKGNFSNIEFISNDSVHLSKIEPHVNKTEHSWDDPTDSTKKRKRRRRRNTNRIHSVVPQWYTSMSFEHIDNVENTAIKPSQSTTSVPLRNESETNNSEMFTLRKTFQKVGSTNECTETEILELMPPQFSKRDDYLNVSKDPLLPRFQEKIGFVVGNENAPENKDMDTLNTLEFDSEDAENIYNDDSVSLIEVEHGVIKIKHTSVAHVSRGKNYENVTVTKTYQEVGCTNHVIEIDDLTLPFTEQWEYGNMLQYKSSSQMENLAMELSSKRSCSETSALSGEFWDFDGGIEHISGLKNYESPMPEESPSYFRCIVKYLHSNQNAIIIGLIVCYVLKRIYKSSSKGMLEIAVPLKYRNDLNLIYFERSFNLNNVFE